MRTCSPYVVAAMVAILALGAPVAAQRPTAPAPPAQPPAAAAPATNPLAGPTWEGLFGFGASGFSTRDNTDRVAEYLVTDQDALASLRALAWGEKNGFRYDLTIANGGDARVQNYDARFDIRRILKAHVTYQTLPHRLDHDPIDYLDGGSSQGGTFIVRNDDMNPDDRYAMTYGVLNTGIDLRLRNVTFFLGHERQTRSGSHQVMTVAHCANCHTVAFTKRYEELTQTLSAGARLTTSILSLEYTYLNRSYEDEAANPLYTFDNAVQPATLQDIFLNRVQYDDADGPLPIAADPVVKKFSNTIRGRLALADATLIGNFTQSKTENDDQNIAYDYTGGFTRLFVPLGSVFSLKADYRRYSLDNESVFVNVVEQTTPEGLAAGKTYSEAFPTAFPATFDFVRESAMSRTPTEVGVELGVQPARRTFLRLGYGWQAIEREFYEVEKTTTNTLYAAGRSQMGKHVNARFRVQYDGTTDPFLHHHAAIPAILQPFPSPGNPPSPLTGLQYYTMYEARQADLTSFPTRTLFLEGMATITPTPRLAITGHYRWRDSQNDELNFSEWGRTMSSPGVDVWFAADERWALTAGVVQQRENLDTLFTTLAFSG
jgi:Putative outer membrane beta-barrel porin, MtrB/PioB